VIEGRVLIPVAVAAASDVPQRAGPERKRAQAADHAAMVSALASLPLREQTVDEALDVFGIDGTVAIDVTAAP